MRTMYATIQLPMINAFGWLCSRTVVIAREDVRGQYIGRTKVGIVIACHGLPQASTTLEQAFGGLGIAADSSVTAEGGLLL